MGCRGGDPAPLHPSQSRGARDSPGSPLVLQRDPLLSPFHLTAPPARQGLAHLSTTRLSRRLKEARKREDLPGLAEFYCFQKIPLARLPLPLPLPSPPGSPRVHYLWSRSSTGWDQSCRVKAVPSCPPPERRRREKHSSLGPAADNGDRTSPSSSSGTEIRAKQRHCLEEGLTAAQRWPTTGTKMS